ncbi:hypothetical protein BYT27DRAFT_7191730 [Phlegmacium glaucopus]|nr:hypothetical protein BYT27DRAFT_7191730 [Phlegmacium glaucopus]
MEVGLGWHLVKLETTILPPIHGSNLRKRYHAALNVLRSISSAYGPMFHNINSSSLLTSGLMLWGGLSGSSPELCRFFNWS